MDPILMGFDKRKLPSPGFQVEVAMPARSKADTAAKGSDGTTSSGYIPKPSSKVPTNSNQRKVSKMKMIYSRIVMEKKLVVQRAGKLPILELDPLNLGQTVDGIQKPASGLEIRNLDSVRVSDIKADASVFSFGDEEDYYESE
ncbi:hypothetical protein GH714_032695 [Hevea brasiliensis]|uniref:Uncharacterized protein n=1 Tax=Hevea brasiliensis TaxID=3981 RepID=A0A6A6L5M4_HEVBR|nr:hypothetical protein GH714_032695 [Hevea brasiliensis]